MKKKEQNDIIRRSVSDYDPEEIEQSQEFVLVDKQPRLDQQTRVATKLFDLISSLSTIDHPLCLECSDQISVELEQKEKEVQYEKAQYKEYLATHEFEVMNQEEYKKLEREIEELEKKDSLLVKELLEIEEERQTLKLSIEKLQKEEEELEKQEELYWEELNDYQLDLEDSLNERETVINKYNHTVEQLEKLRQTNIHSEVFKIWHDGPFGTINNFRLGRLPNQQVEWNEVNAAWGQSAFLLYTLARKLKFQFQNFEIVPRGSFSYMKRIGEDKRLELYETEKIFFKMSRYNDGMIAFLDCLNQLCKHVESKDSNFHIPHRIEADKVGGCSIKNIGQDNDWTKSLKYMLTDLKWLLTWVCRNT